MNIRVWSQSLLIVMLLLGMASCSKEDNTPEVAPEIVETGHDGVLVSLDASGEYDTGGLRSLFTIAADSKVTFKLPANEELVNCIIKSTDPTQPITYVRLRWKRTSDNELYYSYRLPAFNLESGTDLTKGDWYIAGVIGGTIDKNNGGIRFAPNGITRAVEVGGTADINVPFIFSWKPLKIVTVKGQPSLRITEKVTFRPQGVLFRHNFSNEMYNAWSIEGFTIKTNAFCDNGIFKFGDVTAGPTWTPMATVKTFPQIPGQQGFNASNLGASDSGWEMYYTLRNNSGNALQPEVLAASTPATGATTAEEARSQKTSVNNNRYYYTWGMPASGVTDPHTLVQTRMTAVKADGTLAEGTKSNFYHVFYSDVVPVSGRSYSIRSVIRRPPMALETMAEYNLSGDKQFATTHLYKDASGNLTAKYYQIPDYTVAGSMDALSAQVIPDGYHMPLAGEMKGIFSSGLEVGATSADKNAPSISDRDQHVLDYRRGVNTFYRGEYTYHAKTKGTEDAIHAESEAVIYGLRWLNPTYNLERNMFASAWHYEYVSNITPGQTPAQPALIIRQRYLGPVLTQTFQEISQRSWWQAQSVPLDDEVVRTLPLTGYIHKGTPYLVGTLGMLMDVEATKSGQATVNFFRYAKTGVVTNISAFYYSNPPAGSPYPADVNGVDRPRIIPPYTDVQLPVRPFKTHNFRERYKERRTSY